MGMYMMAAVAIILALLCNLILPSCAATEYHVRSATVDCPAESNTCLTLNDYARDPDQYFTENSSFFLLEDVHYLNTSLRLVNAVNISLMGTNTNTVIMLSGACITFNNSEKIMLKSLQIVQSESSASIIKESLQIVNTLMAQLVDVIFTSNLQAVNLLQSTASFDNCSFCDSNSNEGQGGAIAVIDCQNVSFFGHNIFANNTATSLGGAIYALNSSITFSGDNTFVDNSAGTDYFMRDYTKGGGAIFASQSKIEFTGFSRFERNGRPGRVGGAIMIVKNSKLNIWNDSLITNNRALSGGALFTIDSSIHFSGSIEISSNSASGFHGGGIFSYNSNIAFQENISLISNTATRKGGGIYLERSILNCQNSVTFFKNMATLSRNLLMGSVNAPDYSINGALHAEGGGVYTLDSNISFSGAINFAENMASIGGGLFILEGTTRLMLQAPVDIIFYSNFASERGGAVYFYDSNSLYSTLCQDVSVERRNCIFEVNDSTTDLLYENVQINFTANDALDAGSILFGGDLEFCKLQVNNVQTNITGYQFLFNKMPTFNISSPEQNVSYVTSLPLRACFCINEHSDCTMRVRDLPVPVERGKKFTISLITIGQLGMPVPSRIFSYILGHNESTRLYNQSYNKGQGNACHDLELTIHSKMSSENLFLYPEGCAALNGMLTAVINFIDCPTGFVLVDEDHCECAEELKELGAICDIDRGLIRRGINSSVWIQPIKSEGNYSGLIWQKKCSTSYCKRENGSMWLDFSTTDDFSDILCQPNRKGRLCGECKKHYSLVLSSFECKICTNSSLGLLVFFAVAGIALIAILFALHMTVATGTINGLILYANVVNICRDEFFKLDMTPNVLSVFIAWINLDFGIPLCFYDGLDAYSYSWLQFAFPFYLWFLIGLIILVCKFSSRVGRLFGSNPVAVLATVILMSYTKLLETTVAVFSSFKLNSTQGQFNVWSHDPTLPFFGKKYAVLAAFSIFVIIFLLVPYVFLLLFGYYLLAFSGRRGFTWFNKFKPFLDAYYAPFNKKARCWTGIFLLIRVVLFLCLALDILNSHHKNLILIVSLFTGIASILWLCRQNVYEKAYVNILESSFILNLCILLNVTYHVQAMEKGNQPPVTYLSVGIAFLEFVGIVIFHLYYRIRSKKTDHALNCILNKFVKPLKMKSAKEVKEVQPVITTSLIALREPLLEDDY